MAHATIPTTASCVRWVLPALFCLAVGGCASGPGLPPEAQLAKLKEVTYGPVETRQQNQLNSQLVEDVLDTDVLMGMNRIEVAQKLGKGDMCQYHKLCLTQGFEDDDWYYVVGEGDEAEVGKRPAMIVGFNHRGSVDRTYQLRIH